MTLANQILDAFPSGNYGILGLLRLMDIVESTEIETASIECRELPVLRINPNFVATFASTPGRLLMLVLHEIHHVLLGHTRLFKRITPLDNLVFDAVINALLCRMFPTREYTSLFTGFYSARRFPECFLRPPDRWRPAAPAAIPPALNGKELARFQPLYRTLYSDQGADYHQLYRALKKALPPQGVPHRLLGSHGDEIGELDGALLEAVRAIVEHWPQPPDPIAGRSWASILRDEVITPTRIPSNRERLSALLRRVAHPGPGAGARRKPAPAPFVSPLPTHDRRAIVLRALGVTPFLYAQEIVWPGRQAIQPVHVYLDVSGSISDLKDALYGAVLECRHLVHSRVHLFSTEVHDISLEELRRGVCRSTGGTSIECVVAHMHAHAVRRAVIITDGFVGVPGETARRALDAVHLGVALTPDGNHRHDLEPFVDLWTELKEFSA
ncbi:MAG: hypothetical protein FJW38_21460 [Acidobacteria bacterium]|nr:hypothetical protein [Acidobacteriota bacterium]